MSADASIAIAGRSMMTLIVTLFILSLSGLLASIVWLASGAATS